MNNLDVKRNLDNCEKDLNDALAIITSLGGTTNVVPFLNKFGIIRACGTIETSYKIIIADYINRRSKIQVKKFINNSVRDSSSNPSYSNICKMLKKFDASWYTRFKNDASHHSDFSKIRTSIESLVDARNEFAHGGNPNVSLNDVIDYFTNCRTLIEILDNIVC